MPADFVWPLIECELERPTLIIAPFHVTILCWRRQKKEPRKLKTQSTGRSFFFFSLKETESLEGWWWWWWLRPGFGSCTFCTLYSLNSRFVPSFCRPGRICHALIQQTFTKALLCPGPHGRFCIQRNDKDLASDLWEFRTRGSESQNIQTHTDSLGSVSDPGGMFVCLFLWVTVLT